MPQSSRSQGVVTFQNYSFCSKTIEASIFAGNALLAYFLVQFNLNYLKFLYCRKWPINIHIYYQISPHVTESLQMSLKLTKSHEILPNLLSQRISPNLTISHQKILQILTKSHKVSPELNVRLGLHVGQYYVGACVFSKKTPDMF